MRILHIIPSMAGGGAEAQLVCLAGELVRKGLDTHVALLYERGDNLPALRDTGATIHVLEHFANAFDPRLFARIRHLLADVKPDLVQVWSTPIELYVSVLAPLQRVPWILGERNRGPWNPGSIGSPPIGQIANILRILCSYGAKQIVPNSQAAAERWHAVHFVGKKRVTRIANALLSNPGGLDEEPFVWPEDATGMKILCAGRLHRQKNWLYMLDMLKCAESALDFTVLVFGQGEQEEELKTRIEKLGLGERVRMMGYVNNLGSAMRQADLFLSTSSREGHPNVVMEALAAGCGTVLSDIPEHREFGELARATLLPLGDAPAAALRLSEAAQRLRETPIDRNQAEEHWLDFWSPATMTEAYVRLYQRLSDN